MTSRLEKTAAEIEWENSFRTATDEQLREWERIGKRSQDPRTRVRGSYARWELMDRGI